MSCHQEDSFVFFYQKRIISYTYTYTVDQHGNKTTQTDEALFTKLGNT